MIKYYEVQEIKRNRCAFKMYTFQMVNGLFTFRNTIYLKQNSTKTRDKPTHHLLPININNVTPRFYIQPPSFLYRSFTLPTPPPYNYPPSTIGIKDPVLVGVIPRKDLPHIPAPLPPGLHHWEMPPSHRTAVGDPPHAVQAHRLTPAGGKFVVVETKFTNHTAKTQVMEEIPIRGGLGCSPRRHPYVVMNHGSVHGLFTLKTGKGGAGVPGVGE